MCRMLGAVGPLDEAAPLLLRFRHEASRGKVLVGDKPGHRDGWGIARARLEGRVAHTGRSAADAERDPAYPVAAEAVAAPERGIAIVHVRAASLGAIDLHNAHPFVEDGLAFCHNGTIHSIAAAGESDSRAYFARILDLTRAGEAPPDALVAVARELSKDARSFSSITCLLTDGSTLWGLRKVGEDPAECADGACAADYYSLGHTRIGGLTVVTQEHEFVGLDREWSAVPDGHLAEVRADGGVRTRRVL